MSAYTAISRLSIALTATIPFAAWASLAARIQGSVRDADTSKPVAYANVIVLGTPLGAVTEMDGTFVIEGLQEGEHELQATFVGYERLQLKLTIPADSRIDFALEKWGAALRKSFTDSIGSSLIEDKVNLVCEIVPSRPHYRVGEHPDFQVRVRNEGEVAVYLPLSVDGSPYAGRYPFAQLEFSGSIPSQEGYQCPHVFQLHESDFVYLEPGEELDPYSSGYEPRTLTNVFTEAGTYRVTFRYSTESGDVTQWLGFPQGMLTRGLATLLKNTPKIALECVVEVEVVE